MRSEIYLFRVGLQFALCKPSSEAVRERAKVAINH